MTDDFDGDNGGPKVDPLYDELMDLSVTEILEQGKKALFARLVSACRNGTASHQEMGILRNILKDNGMTLGLPAVGSGQPAGPKQSGFELPDFQKPDYEDE